MYYICHLQQPKTMHINNNKQILIYYSHLPYPLSGENAPDPPSPWELLNLTFQHQKSTQHSQTPKGISETHYEYCPHISHLFRVIFTLKTSERLTTTTAFACSIVSCRQAGPMPVQFLFLRVVINGFVW